MQTNKVYINISTVVCGWACTSVWLNNNSAIFDETVDNLFCFSSLLFLKWERFMIYKYSQRSVLYWLELNQCAPGIY